MLPAPIVERLRRGETVIADHYPSATILFCDLVGFTALADRLHAGRTVALLNTVFSALDRLTSTNDLEKIKTIGDAYMVAAGCRGLASDHVQAVVGHGAHRSPTRCEQAGARSTKRSKSASACIPGRSSPGIIGTDKMAYDVWGDTVNVASRMERTGVPGRVHITAAVRAALGAGLACDALPPMDIKGKGLMETFLIS